MKRYKAKVVFKVEVEADGVWGEDATVEQVVNQAGRESLDKFKNLVCGKQSPFLRTNVRAGKVEAVTISQEEL